jgi:hypothetical protein
MDKEIVNGSFANNDVSYDVSIKDGKAVITLTVDSPKVVSDIEAKVPGAIPHALLEAVKGFLTK